VVIGKADRNSAETSNLIVCSLEFGAELADLLY
jgi:hypothetical protein